MFHSFRGLVPATVKKEQSHTVQVKTLTTLAWSVEDRSRLLQTGPQLWADHDNQDVGSGCSLEL